MFDNQGGSDPRKSFFDLVFFNNIVTRMLNKSDTILTATNFYKIVASPVIGIITPIVYFVVPYFVLVSKLKSSISFTSYIRMMFSMMFSANSLFMGSGVLNSVKYVSYALSLLFYFQGIFNSIEISKLSYKVTKIIHRNTKDFVEFIQAAKNLCDVHWNDDITSSYVSHDMASDMQKHKLQEQTCCSILNKTSVSDFSVFSNFGKALKLYKSLDVNALRPLIWKAYTLDALLCIVDCVITKEASYVDFCLPTNGVRLELDAVRHPCITKNVAITTLLPRKL
jgi:hypothetical protein